MPYHIDREPQGVVVRLWGDCTGLDVEHAMRDMHNHPDFDRLRYVIHDSLSCQSLIFDTHEPELLAATDLGASFTNENVCIGVAATHPDVLNYLSAYVAAQASPYPTRLFDNLDDVRAWVNSMLEQREAGLGGDKTGSFV
jgi:hypothetical protein